jgi:hypothetical protein
VNHLIKEKQWKKEALATLVIKIKQQGKHLQMLKG